MKRILFLLAFLAFLVPAKADEGMWIPMLIGKNYDEMRRLGLKLSEKDIYDINNSSLKDAIVQFAGGCTAEMISENGLLLTNHHCGYGAIAALSTVQNNYLDNGFWAHSLKEELPAQGVTVIFLQHMEDVTDEVKGYLGNATGDEYNKRFDTIRKRIEDRAAKKGKYVANVKDFFNGNQFILLVYQKYTDVRLVGTPPKSLGKFGGDTDNWMWPRHTSDFSMFRVYADSNNNPAAYSAKNVPYHPKKYLPVSAKGVNEGDYAMIMGYPGRTNRYEVSYGIDLAINVVNPSIVAIRDLRLDILHRHMAKDKAVYLKLTSQTAGISNYWKYYIGQTEQLKRLHVLDKKQKQENAFAAWAKANNTDADLMDKFGKIYNGYAPYAKHSTYYNECFKAATLSRLAASTEPLLKYLEKHENNKDSLKHYAKPLKAGYRDLMKSYDESTDKEMFAQMTQLFCNNIPKEQWPDIYVRSIMKPVADANDNMLKACTAYADNVYKNTFLLDSNKFNAFCDSPTLAMMQNDPAITYAVSFVRNYEKNYLPKIEEFINEKKVLSRTYIKDLMTWKKDKWFAPDANSTMRLTYGQVLSYDPQDAVHYNYFTTLDGLMAKYKPGNDEFEVPKELIKLYNDKDYGSYADKDGTLHTCFITNNDITGGNSGSPVMNAKGELIGAAFDGNWEAMSGDIAFDKKYKRTIVCDIRFILFLIDKMGHANNLIEEMDIRR